MCAQRGQRYTRPRPSISILRITRSFSTSTSVISGTSGQLDDPSVVTVNRRGWAYTRTAAPRSEASSYPRTRSSVPLRRGSPAMPRRGASFEHPTVMRPDRANARAPPILPLLRACVVPDLKTSAEAVGTPYRFRPRCHVWLGVAPKTMTATMRRRMFLANSTRGGAPTESFRTVAPSVLQEPVAGPRRFKPFGVHRLIEAGVAGYQT